MIDIEQIKLTYIQNDLPVPYKLLCKKTIYLHSIKVRDWILANNLSVFLLDKNKTPSAEIIQMSYLKFLDKVHFRVNESEKIRFKKILSLVLNYDISNIDINYSLGKVCVVLLDDEKKIDCLITSKEFDEITKIILFQNILDYNDDYVSPIMAKIVEDYLLAMPKDRKMPTLEEQKIYVFSKTSIPIQDINGMSYRLFLQTYNMLYECEEYLSARILQSSQKFKIEDKEHPLHTQKQTIFEKVVGSKQRIYQELNKVQ